VILLQVVNKLRG